MYLQIDDTNLVLKVYKTNRPRFSSHRGRTWDGIHVFVNGKETRFVYDTTGGTRAYINIDNTYYVLGDIFELGPVGYNSKLTIITKEDYKKLGVK